MKPAASNNRVLFICRGSVHDGLGHVIRTRRVASVLAEKCAVKMVVIGDESAEALLVSQNIDFTITPHERHALTHYRHFRPSVVVFDLTHLDDEAFAYIRAECPTVSLSPIFSGMDHVNLVLHRTQIAGRGWGGAVDGPVFECGLQFAIISDHCARIPHEAYRRSLDHESLAIAVSMGGADAPNKSLAVLNRLKEVPEKLLVWVLLGEGYAHSYEDLVRCMKGSRHEIILAKTTDSMWRILNTCALAVLAGGTTTYEAAFAGLPSVNTLESEDHYFLIQELVGRGAALHAGYTFEESLQAIRGIVGRLHRNRGELMAMHESCEGLLDDLGATRVAQRIAALVAPLQVVQ